MTEAVEAFVAREVAALRALGCQVWVSRCAWTDAYDGSRAVFRYWLALDDEQGEWFEPYYNGPADDQLPVGYDDFGLFYQGGKSEPPSVHMSNHVGHLPEVVEARDETPLRFVARIDSPQAARAWLSRPDAYVRCDECRSFPSIPVLVGDPEQECECGAFERDDDGRLTWEEKYAYTFPAVYLRA
ncbi:hypothetical protein [Streptomyces sp. NRRL F-5123]|uniref:hypothetical protein n=1 Tax=Streptomyces sp. NRRL F-5123 TaxID=1463856 RepID=UPI00131A6A86|nr:hypothetical protein [Streptomyces sp. NRRL F-5123]